MGDAKPYTLEDLNRYEVIPTEFRLYISGQRLIATVEALDRVTRERDFAADQVSACGARWRAVLAAVVGASSGIKPGADMDDVQAVQDVVRLWQSHEETRAMLEAALREVTALTGELTPDAWSRLSDVQSYIRHGGALPGAERQREACADWLEETVVMTPWVAAWMAAAEEVRATPLVTEDP